MDWGVIEDKITAPELEKPFFSATMHDREKILAFLDFSLNITSRFVTHESIGRKTENLIFKPS